jgi:magnesium transporter
MPADERWIDLLDPTPEELKAHLPESIHDRALEQLLQAPQHGDEPRPKLEGQGDYIFGVLLVAVSRPGQEELYQEIDLVITAERLLTVRKTPTEGEPFDCTSAMRSCRQTDSIGMMVYHLVDEVAEHYLDIVDAINDEIDELEDKVEELESSVIRSEISTLRHDLLHLRRTLAPTRDAVREVMDDRVELEGVELFPREVELNFGSAYDKLMRASDGLELSRDLVAGVRDYHQAKVANDQNEVMKRLTVIASMLLVPTLIVGLYGQNFVNIPELTWNWGYGWSLGLIAVTTVAQYVFFKWKKWI